MANRRKESVKYSGIFRNAKISTLLQESADNIRSRGTFTSTLRNQIRFIARATFGVFARAAGANKALLGPTPHSRIEHALEHTRDAAKVSVRREAAATRLAGLTPRQRQIMELVLAGHPSTGSSDEAGGISATPLNAGRCRRPQLAES